MADRTDDLLISVSTDLSTIKRQLKQLGQDIGTTTSGIQKQFDGLGKGIDQSLTPVQKRINALVGIPVTSKVKEWKGALADTATGFTAVGKGAQITSSQLLNLSRQGNDVVTMFALGAKPMQIFASQAGQIFGALQEGPGGVAGSLKGLGAQAVGLATKFPLATAAIAAAGVALAAYLALGGTSIRSLDEILKSHEENIKRLGDAYDQVVGKQQKYAQVSAATANLINDK
ncbi:phage tail length tape measure family protein, partial [Mesorhizobium sp. BR1-1-7]|uniref:phage tail length tape measure family protein n=1 Tax=Mesorhizobium sp. BR1-1-7 TaxID=2876647 RepID=UPI001CCCE400